MKRSMRPTTLIIDVGVTKRGCETSAGPPSSDSKVPLPQSRRHAKIASAYVSVMTRGFAVARGRLEATAHVIDPIDRRSFERVLAKLLQMHARHALRVANH